MVQYFEITCKTAMSVSQLPGLDYSLNPYMGCEHACIYCYAPYTIRYNSVHPWGSFVAAKVNIPIVLEREVRKKKHGVVGISTVSDPYQKVEEKLRLTRSCLEVLLVKGFPVCIQTKSTLVTRDLDLIREFKSSEVGLTITTIDDTSSRLLEPGAPVASERLKTLRIVSDAGVPSWAFIGPVVPGIMDTDKLRETISSIKDAGASRVMIDHFRLKPGMWKSLELYLKDKDPFVLEACKRALFKDKSFFESIRAEAIKICDELKIGCEINY